MSAKFFVDGSGAYIGAFDGAEPPANSVEVPTAPADARQVWDGSAWGSVPAMVPQKVTMRQARLALHGAGLLAGVEAAIDEMQEPQRTAARIEWDYSSEVYRNKPFVLLLSQALGLTDTQLDGLFIAAVSL